MLREAVLLCLWVVCAVDSQPLSCTEGDHCSEGYYCDTSVHICEKCLQCEDFKREPPLTNEICIDSVTQCGACFKGLVLDRLGDVNSPCVVAVPEAPSGPLQYVWWLGSAVIIFLTLMIGIIVYIYLNPGIFEHFKLGAGNCQAVSTNITTEARASAPEAPPPYSPHYAMPYTPVKTAESPCPPNEAGDYNVHAEEEGPFIIQPPVRQPGPRETAGRQAARVFNYPIYEREEQPHSPEAPIVTEVDDNLPIHDEDTVESPWTPNGPNNADVNANVSEAGATSTGPAHASTNLPAMLAVAREDSLFEPTPAKQMRFQSGTTYTNGNSSSSSDSSKGNFSGTQNGAPYNIITQITNVVQFNKSS